LLETILSKKDLFVSAVTAVIAIVIAISFTKNFFTETSLLNNEIALIKEKIEVITDYDVGQRNIKKFIKSAPQSLDEELLSSTIVDLVTSNNLTIISFVPGHKKEEKLYNKISADLNIEAPNFHSLLSFLNAISKAPFALRVDRCSVGVSQGNRGMMGMDNSGAKKGDAISVSLELSSIEIKK